MATKLKVKHLSDEARDVLSRGEIEEMPNGTAYRVTEQLDRKLYVEVNAALEEHGGLWNRKLKAHLFAKQPAAELRERLDSLADGGEFTPKSSYGWFPTPRELAADVVNRAELEAGMLVLEPSAGQGALADLAARDVGRDNVYCVELLAENVAVLKQKGYTRVATMDFLAFAPQRKFDRVVMNPPFAGAADIDHVLHALRFLKPGGRLLAVMSWGAYGNTLSKARDFQVLMAKLRGRWTQNKADAFKEAGTAVRTMILTLDAPR